MIFCLRFPSATMPLEHMLSLIPCVKPRLYSIASSPRYNATELELAIVILELEELVIAMDHTEHLAGGSWDTCKSTEHRAASN